MKKRRGKFLFILIIFFVLFGRRNHYISEVFQEIKSFESIQKTSQESVLDSLYSLQDENQDIAKILEHKTEYPSILLEMLSRNNDMMDYVLGYQENRGKVFSDTIGKVSVGEYPVLLQYDKRWGYGIYGDEVMAINGCGPTAVAVVIAGLTGRNDITPYDVALYSYTNGYYQDGTSWSFFTKGVEYFGIKGTEIPLSKSAMIQELKQGHPIICSMRKGDFTTTGHIIAITGMKEDKFIVRDSNSRKRSNQLWRYEEIEGQIKNLWAYQVIQR